MRAQTPPGHARLINDHEAPGKPSWRYGTPGIARALQMAGIGLSDLDLQDRAEVALLDDASSCHGWAGILHTARPASQHAPRLKSTLPRLLTGLVAASSPLGTGILTGTVGVALVERAMLTATAPRTRRDALVLLDD